MSPEMRERKNEADRNRRWKKKYASITNMINWLRDSEAAQ
jgi:hypothetical protein